MKIFWSWQSDTPGKIGRHFVRDALLEAIEKLQVPEDIEEPQERETREAMHLDSDRQGVPGSPDLAATIFNKIDNAAVFVADMTLTGAAANNREKHFINSNVAIEYGHAHGKLGDEKILMVQNTHYGDRSLLPFDLRHKAGPIEFRLDPQASGAEIKATQAQLRDRFVVALRPYLKRDNRETPPFTEIPPTDNRSVYFNQGDILASVPTGFGEAKINYIYAMPRAFYLRLIPTSSLHEELKMVQLRGVVDRRELDVLTRRAVGAPLPSLNKFGATAYEFIAADASGLRAVSQAFRNGELWAVSNEFFIQRREGNLIPAKNVENIFKRVAGNFCEVAKSLEIDAPYTMECGAFGIENYSLGVGHHDVYGPIHQNEVHIRLVVNDTRNSKDELVEVFLDALFDLTGTDRSTIRDG
jgi:hypothetical protein